MTFGLTPQGFVLKRLDDILTDLQTDINAIVDPISGETPNIDLRGDDPIAQITHAYADANSQSWEILELIARSFDPSQNTGAAQSGSVQLNGVTRNPGSRSTIPITITGSAGTIITAGRRISDLQQNVIWLTDVDVTIGAGGTVNTTASSEDNGAFVQLTATVTTILTPQNGWLFVTNTADSTLGTADETDEELRARRDNSTEVPGIGPIDSIFGNLLEIDGVTFARVRQNNTLTTNALGIPAKSIAAVIVGGDDNVIASVLFERNSGLGDYFGTTAVNIPDLQGEPNIIRWTRPTLIPIFVAIDITVLDTSTFPTNGADEIRAAIILYAQGGARALGIDMGFEDNGIVPGEDVQPSRLYTPTNSVPGHRINSLQIGLTSGTVGITPISISFDELASFDSANILITGA